MSAPQISLANCGRIASGEAFGRPAVGTAAPSEIVAENGDEFKAQATMAARAARAGCGLYKLSDGDFLLCKYGMAQSLPDLRSVGALLDRITGVSA